MLDLQAAAIANRLVGNPVASALLESTFGGVTIRFEQDTKVAVTGADVNVEIDRFPMPIWETLIAPAGSEFSVSMPSAGLYAYVAIEGGIDVPEVLGSRSTHIASGLGGYQGRALIEATLCFWVVHQTPYRALGQGPRCPRICCRHAKMTRDEFASSQGRNSTHLTTRRKPSSLVRCFRSAI